ncbi:MAG: response regulator [Elainellaceae cyanobacterium]
MFNRPCQILLVEDSPSDYALFKRLLDHSQSSIFSESFDLSRVATLEAAMTHLEQQGADVVFLDLLLPDSRGIESLQKLRQFDPAVPVVVQTTLEDEAIAVQALQHGANGYLPKAKMDSNLVVYAIRAAIEQRQQLASLGDAQQQQLDAYVRMMERHDHSSGRGDRPPPLQEREPEIFAEMAQDYGTALDGALEQRVYKVDRRLNYQIQGLAQRLGYLQASPRDVMNLHTTVLRAKAIESELPPQKAQAYMNEGNFLVLELMGDLAAYYQQYFVGLKKLSGPKGADAATEA